jgi:intracellular multiplication protein IcmK
MKKILTLFVISCFTHAVFAVDEYSLNQLEKSQSQKQEQLQAIIKKIKSMDKDSVVDTEDEAFKEIKNKLFPLSPEQIKQVRFLYNDTKQAAAVTERVPAKPVSSVIAIDLSPGATPPVIRLSAGFVSSIVFLDSTGAPWPIKAYDIGDPQAFNIQWQQGSAAEEKVGQSMNNTMLIQPSAIYKHGNLAVMLRGLNTPIMFTLLPGQRVVDYRLDVQVPGMGPLANAASISHLPMQANPSLLNVLNNIAPPNAKALEIEGGDARAWVDGSTMYLRTSLTLVSPSWVSTMSSSDGMVRAYSLPVASVLLAMYNGKLIKLSVKGL